jgi:hypothetical protein
MFDELRRDLPPLPALVSDGDQLQQWLTAMRQVIQAMDTPERRQAATILVADDFVRFRYPWLPLSTVYRHLKSLLEDDHDQT